VESGIYGIDLKNGIWNMECGIWNGQNRGIYGINGMEFPKLWNFIKMSNMTIKNKKNCTSKSIIINKVFTKNKF
jgi:hypothetical protein